MFNHVKYSLFSPLFSFLFPLPKLFFSSLKMLGLSFLFSFLISILILKLNCLDILVCAVGDSGAVLHHFCYLYWFRFLGSSKPWITAGLETIPGEYSLNPHAVLTAFHQCQTETGYWGKLYQYSFSVFLIFLHSGWVFYPLGYYVMFLSLFCAFHSVSGISAYLSIREQF